MYKFFAAAAAAFTLITFLSDNISWAAEHNYSNLKNKVIMLDSGHGGDDSGAIRHGVKESRLNLAAALELRKYLELLGAKVIMTRDSDRAVSLNERFDAVETKKPDLFISLHHNDASDNFYKSADFKNYTEVYFSSLYDGGLENITSGLCFYEAFKELHKVNSVKLKPGYFKVIRSKTTPSILMEPFFMGEERLVKLAASPAYARHEALTYIKAINAYFNRISEPLPDKCQFTTLAGLNFETAAVFLSAAGGNEKFLQTAASLLNANNIKTVVNSNNFMDGRNISRHYISKLLTVKNYLEADLLEAYIEAIRSNAVSAKIHVSFTFNAGAPESVSAYYRSDNGKKLSALLIDNFKKIGASLEFQPASFYVLSSTSSVTAVVNLNPARINLNDKHILFSINSAVYNAVKTYLISK
jgi:N-acetylmuramoyl-L-alanine amidase